MSKKKKITSKDAKKILKKRFKPGKEMACKSKCCDKYKKGEHKRCKKCPCFDLLKKAA